MGQVSKDCKTSGIKTLPNEIHQWHVQDLILWSTLAANGAKLFAHRNVMAQFCHDLALLDGPAWASKLIAIWDASDEIDKEYRRLDGMMDNLDSLSKSQLEADRALALRMRNMAKALAGFEYDKKLLPTFYTHMETWKQHLDAWHEQYAMYYKDFGMAIEDFSKEKGVFKRHGKCVEDLTFDEIEKDIPIAFSHFYHKLNMEIVRR